MPYKIGLSLLFIFTAFSSFAVAMPERFADSTHTNSAWRQSLALTTEYQYFKTVHHSLFNGGYTFLTYNTTPQFSMGLGIAYDYSVLHVDNGYDLRHVKILPVLTDFRFVPFYSWPLSPFLISDVGYSTFIKYEQEDPRRFERTRNVTDKGLYTFGGGGLAVKLSNTAVIYTSTGFTGVHMSFNNEDVNPRGLMYRVGIKVGLQ